MRDGDFNKEWVIEPGQLPVIAAQFCLFWDSVFFLSKLLICELWVRNTFNPLLIIWGEDSSKQSSLNRLGFFQELTAVRVLSIAMLKCQE